MTTFFFNSHNQSTKKINDMLMSVKDEKILLVIKQLRCSLRVVTASDQKDDDLLIMSIY